MGRFLFATKATCVSLGYILATSRIDQSYYKGSFYRMNRYSREKRSKGAQKVMEEISQRITGVKPMSTTASLLDFDKRKLWNRFHWFLRGYRCDLSKELERIETSSIPSISLLIVIFGLKKFRESDTKGILVLIHRVFRREKLPTGEKSLEFWNFGEKKEVGSLGAYVRSAVEHSQHKMCVKNIA